MAKGTKQDPWALKTPPGTSGYTMYKDEQAEPAALVCQVGSTRSGTTLGRSRTCMLGWSRKETGSRLGLPMRVSPQRQAPSRSGDAPPKIQLEAGTGCGKGTEAASGCTSLRC